MLTSFNKSKVPDVPACDPPPVFNTADNKLPEIDWPTNWSTIKALIAPSERTMAYSSKVFPEYCFIKKSIKLAAFKDFQQFKPYTKQCVINIYTLSKNLIRLVSRLIAFTRSIHFQNWLSA
jgi:hypothetical protein